MTDRSVVVRLRYEVGQAAASLTKLSVQTKALASETSTAAHKNQESFKKIGLAAGVASGAILLGLGKAVSAAANFDKAMSSVGAAANASASELKALRDAALDAGKATVFSASEAAAAEEALVKAGVSAGDVLGGALRGSLDLAATGNQSVAESAETAASAMTIFGLKGKDVGMVADTLAAGAGKAQGEISDLSAGLQQSGAVANQMGQSLQDTVGALALFASKGIIGSDAGTSFKQMLLSLTPASLQAKVAMEEYGLSFFEANGKAKSFTDIAGLLHDKLGGLDQQTQTTALKTIFGADAFRVAAIAMEAGAEGAADWKAKVNDAGFASDQAGEKLDNLAGDLEQLRGSIETALIEGGSSATGVLRLMTQAATGAVNGLGELPAPLGTALFGFTALSSAGLGVLALVGMLVPRLEAGKKALSEMGRAGQFAGTGLGWAAKGSVYAVGFLALAEGIHALADKADELFHGKPNIEATTGALLDLANGVGSLQGVLHTGRTNLDELRQGLDLLEGKDRRSQESGVAKMKNELDDFDKSLAVMVQTGSPQKAAAMVKQLADMLDLSPKELKRFLDDYTGATGTAEVRSKAAAAAAKELGGGLEGVQPPADAAADALNTYNDALDRLSGSTFGLQEATDKVDQGIQSLASSILQARDDGDKWAGTLNAMSMQGLSNREALRGLVDDVLAVGKAMAEQGAPPEAIAAMFAAQRDRLFEVTDALGISRNAAAEYIDMLLQAAGINVTNTVVLHTEQAIAALQTYMNALYATGNLQDRVLAGNLGLANSKGFDVSGQVPGMRPTAPSLTPVRSLIGDAQRRQSGSSSNKAADDKKAAEDLKRQQSSTTAFLEADFKRRMEILENQWAAGHHVPLGYLDALQEVVG